MIELKLNPTDKEVRIFALSQVLLAAVVAWFVRGLSWSAAGWILVGSAVVAVLGCVFPRSVRWLYAAWMLAAFPIGWVMSYVMAGAVYFLLITPIGLIMRLVGRDPLHREFESERSSYWTVRPPAAGPDRYFKQF